MGTSLLNAFTAVIDPTDTALLTASPTIAFDMYSLSQTSTTSYTIRPEDMFDLSGSTTNTLTDTTGENSVMAADGSTITTVNAGDGDDIIMVGAMSASVTVDGGAGDDILVFADSDSATTDLDNVTNVEIISLTGGAVEITTVDALNDINVQQAGVTINAADITGSLTFNGSAETTGFFTVMGSNHIDTITGGAGDDRIYADDTDTIDGGANVAVNRNTGTNNGDTVVFEQDVDSANLIDTDLVNIETISVFDIGADATEVYDFSVQTEDLFISVTALDSYTGVTLKGGKGDDTLQLGNSGDNIIFADTATNNGADIIMNFSNSHSDKLNVDTFVTDVVGSDFVTFNGAENASVATGSIINLAYTSALDDTNATALFEKDDDNDSGDSGATAKMEIDDGATAILVVQDDNAAAGTDFGAQVYYVESNVDGSTITATLVGTIYDPADSTSLVFGDFA